MKARCSGGLLTAAPGIRLRVSEFAALPLALRKACGFPGRRQILCCSFFSWLPGQAEPFRKAGGKAAGPSVRQ